ncbi:unnamed protein product [Alopecurus aequalis]
MEPEVVASPAPDCPSRLCIWVTRIVRIVPATIVIALLTLMGVVIYKEIHNGMRLLVGEVTLENGNNSQNGNVTLQFTLRAENPTSRRVTYQNITGTLAVLNEDPFLAFPVADIHLKKKPVFPFPHIPIQFYPTQVSVPRIDAADNIIPRLVLMLNGTMETSSRSYRCHLSTTVSMFFKPCSRVRSK